MTKCKVSLPMSLCARWIICILWILINQSMRMHFFIHKQQESGPSPESYLYFQDFQGSKLLNGFLVVWSNKKILIELQWFFSICHWHILYTTGQRSKRFLWNLQPSYLHLIGLTSAEQQLNILKHFGISGIWYFCLLKMIQP